MTEDYDELMFNYYLSQAKNIIYREIDNQFYIKDELMILTSVKDLEKLNYKLNIDYQKIINLAKKIINWLYQKIYYEFGYNYSDDYNYLINKRIKSNIKLFVEKRFQSHGIETVFANLL